MAKLPDYTAFGDRPTPNAVGGVVSYQPETQADDFSAKMLMSVGDKIGQAGDTLNKVFREEENRINTLAAEEAFNKLRESQINLTVGENGFAKKQSGDAVNQPILKEYVDKFNLSAKEIEGGLKNDKQVELFRRRARISGIQLKQEILNHVTKEQGVYSAQVFKGTLDVETQNAVARYQDQNGVAVSLERINAAVKVESDRNGWPPEVEETARANAFSKVHRGVIERMLANDDDISATEYYKENKKQISGPDGRDSVEIEKALEIGSTRGEAQRNADKLVTGKLLDDAMQKADKISDVKVRQETKKLIRQHYADIESAQNQELELTFEGAAKVAYETRDINKVSPAVLAKLTAKPEYLSIVNALASSDDIKTNWESYYKLKTMAASDSSQFTGTNLLEHRDKLGDPEFKELVSIQTSLKKGDDKDIAGFRTAKQVVDDSLAAAKIDPTPKPGSQDATKAAEFRRQVDMRIASLQDEKKAKLTPVEVQAVVDSMIVEGVTQKRWWWTDVKKRAFEVKPGESFEVGYEDIPQSERSKIEAALKGRNIPVTEESVKGLYMKKLERDRGK